MNAPEQTVSFDFSPGHAMRITTPVPDMGSGPIGTESVTDPEYYERERERVFKRSWLEVGRVEELPEVGDYFTRELQVLGTNALVIRGKDGQIRAFHNMCTHRGMALGTRPCGNKRVLTCEFHGWVYGLDGELLDVPAQASFPDLDKSRQGLRRLACETWNGFIFIHWDPQPAVGLEAYLGQLGRDMDGFPFDQCHHIAHYSARVKANWKVCIDAFHEAYHATHLHRRSIPGAGSIELALPSSARFHGLHRSISCWLEGNIVPTPAEAIAYQHASASFSKPPELTLDGINPSGDKGWWFDINVMYPNFFCDLGAGWYFTYNFWPTAVNETIWNMNIYQLEAMTAGERIVQEFTRVVLRDTVYEDMSTVELSQKAFDSGVITEQVLGATEIAVRHQYWVTEQLVNGKSVG